MLNKENVLGWNEKQIDLFTDSDGRTFGAEIDFFNCHVNFFIRYPFYGERLLLEHDIYKAIDIFNKDGIGEFDWGEYYKIVEETWDV